MTATFTRVDEAYDFLLMLHGEDADGWLTFFRDENDQTDWLHASDLRTAAEMAIRRSQSCNVWQGVGLRKYRQESYRRGGEKDIASVPGLWAEIDMGGPIHGRAHSAQNLPPTYEAARDLLDALPFAPSMVIDSGHGIQAYVLFRETWTIDSDADRQRLRSLNDRYQSAVRSRARDYGWDVDPTSDLARVLRIPGTINHKLDPVPVRVIERDNNARYTLDYLEEMLPSEISAGLSEPLTRADDKDFPAANINGILAGCTWSQHCVEDAATLNEPEWYAFLSHVGRCVDGQQLAHEFSAPHAGYSAKETNAKLRQALHRSGPRTCKYVHDYLGGARFCDTCQYWNASAGKSRIGTPLTLGRPKAKPIAGIPQTKNGNGVHHMNGNGNHTGEIPPADPPVENVDNVNVFPPVLPRVDAGDLHLSRVTTAALDAILDANDPPFLFRQGGQPIRIETGDNDEPIMRTLTEDRLRHVLARLIDWYKILKTKQGLDELPALPPIHVVKDILATPDLPLPRLEMVTEAPTFAPDGTLDTRPGYHRATRTYYAPAAGFTVPDVPMHPTAIDIAKARTLIVDELLADFPFISDAERANAVALLLLPFVRPLIHGPVPLHLFEKPQAGTGASLMADVITMVATGRSPAVMTAGRDEDEWRKRITSNLRAGVQHIQIDNIRDRLDSSSLAAAITATSWTDRLLGGNETITLPVRCIWIATGNNPALSSEITRRTIRIRLDAKQDRPWERTEFRHANLRAWATEHRSDLVWAALTLIRAWFAAGKPNAPASPILGSFEAWARIMGGILNTAGITGFLANLKEFYEESDTEGTEIRAFLQNWWDKHGSETVSVATLYEIASGPDSGLDLKAKSERGEKVRLGRLLMDLRDRHYRLDGATVGIKHDGTYKRLALWRLVPEDSGVSHDADTPTGNRDADAENASGDGTPGVSSVFISPRPCVGENSNYSLAGLSGNNAPDTPDTPAKEDDDAPTF